MWTVPRDWAGETVAVIAGGPSVLQQDLSLLSGRRVIVINSAWKTYPDADVLFFGDARWFDQLGPKPSEFSGRVVTAAPVRAFRHVLLLAKVGAAEISTDPGKVAFSRSSVTGAINLAVHFGAEKILLLGVDGQIVNGIRHNHGVQYPWPLKEGCFDQHAAEFRQFAPSIPVPVINCSPISNLDVWPKMTLEQALEGSLCGPAAGSDFQSDLREIPAGDIQSLAGQKEMA